MRRRASSAASTMRTRDSRSCRRASALATACPTSSAKAPRRRSVPGGNGRGRTVDSEIEPQMRPSTTIGAATAAPIPSDLSGASIRSVSISS